ncbi:MULTISPECIES: PLD nuclease N-terminal domain-containing protein [Streptomyces]|uniref:PLD nuclease N-terminal domain-containing protein n=1 Tax=Streptomyces TaxID=1883 RepID=UPI002248A259|nr:PLD nuclease N-terminal domain-containing protein [Streptomyces sp. JHD 1]MCX2968900.1 PLD nuclease N-terminal domain-containing protein [Streptomyces sp. JHD 1]
MLRYLPFLLILAVWIYAFIDVLNTRDEEVRKLPKLAWVFIVLLFGQVLVGPLAWFIAGRPRRNAPYGAVRADERRWVAPDDNPNFLKSLGDPGGRRSPDPEEPPASGDARDTGPEDPPKGR